MNSNTQFIENRAQVDNAIQTLLFETREIVCDLVKPLAAQGKFSLDNIPSDRRGRLRTVDDIAQTMDPTALLAVLMACLSNRSAQALHIPGVNFQLVDKVRQIRNEYSHGDADYNNINYVRDAVNTTNDLRLGLLNARTRLPARQYKPSPNPRVAPSKAQARPPVRQPQPTEVNAKGEQGNTQLHLAAMFNHPEIANALIVAGAEVNAKNDTGETALHYAAERQRIEIVKILIAAGAQVTAKNNRNRTPIDIAKRRRHNWELTDLLKSARTPAEKRKDRIITLIECVAAALVFLLLYVIYFRPY